MQRPIVFVNMAMTVDGKITSATREYPGFSSKIDRLGMDRLRAGADAIVVGAGTLRADNPTLHVRDAEMRRLRESLGKPPWLPRVAVTASGNLPADGSFFRPDSEGRTGPTYLATVENGDSKALESLPTTTEVWRLGRDRVDLVAMLRRLGEQGYERVLVEGGGELNWCLLEADLVDEFYVTIAPAMLGGRESPTLLEGTGFRMKQQRRLRLVDLRREGDELFCHYEVVRP